MDWPLPQDYNEAIQNPRSTFADPELRQGEAATNALGLPMPRSGSFADVYEVRCPATNTRWAVKCFTRAVADLRERYAEISNYLRQLQLPFFVDFNYLQKGIRIQGEWYGIVKMDWIEGLLLNEFIRDAADNPGALDGLLQVWLRMARRLRETRLAHGDLQHGNVLLVPGTKTRSLAIKLIDYDGMFVPSLADRKPGEAGHPNYQHPLRAPQQLYNLDIDRFPLLLVATVLRCLKVGGRRLWDRWDNGDNLLFREADLQGPAESALLHELWHLADPDAHNMVGHLLIATQQPPEQTPLPDEFFVDGKVLPLSPNREQEVKTILASAKLIRPPPPVRLTSSPEHFVPSPVVSPYNLAALVPESSEPVAPGEMVEAPWRTPRLRSTRGERQRRLIFGGWAVGMVTAAGLLIGLALWAMTPSTPTKARSVALTKNPKPAVSQIAREEISKEVKAREEVIQSPQPRPSLAPSADRGPVDAIEPKKPPEKQAVDTPRIENPTEPKGGMPAQPGKGKQEAEAKKDETVNLPTNWELKFNTGKAKPTYDSKTGVLKLSYDFADARQLKDFKDTDAVTVKRGVLTVKGGDEIQHVVKFKTISVSVVVVLGGVEVPLQTSSGYWLYAAGNDQTVIDVGYGKSEDNFIAGKGLGRKIHGTNTPLTITEWFVSDTKVGIKAGGIDVSGKKRKDAPAGHLILSAKSAPNRFQKLTLSGILDPEWAKGFFADKN
jgi:hypothetical protein